MIIKKAQFLISVAEPSKISDFNKSEIAVVGKSNVGKSSLINLITNNKNLAKTSQTPGRTRLVNYFDINGEFILVDLPGYGFAKAPASEIAKWRTLIKAYLINNKNLKNVFLLLDIRREPSENDFKMVNFLSHYNIPFTCVATKADKLKKEAIKKSVQKIASALRIGYGNIIVTSALKKEGVNLLLERIEQILN